MPFALTFPPPSAVQTLSLDMDGNYHWTHIHDTSEKAETREYANLIIPTTRALRHLLLDDLTDIVVDYLKPWKGGN